MPRTKKTTTPSNPPKTIPTVPEAEWPYKVPENWRWVRLGSLGYTNIGLTYKPADKSDDGIIVLRSCNILEGHIVYDDIVKVKINIPDSKMSQKGDILICARNGSKSLVGKSAIIDKDGMSYGAFMAIFRSPYNRMIYYYLNSQYFRDIIDHEVGTTTINQVTQQLIKELPFPLPPLAEQQRIVDRIERLFAKLDEAREKAQAVVDGFENRKAAILHKAFTGELTKKWREERGIGMESWTSVIMNSVLDVRDGTHDSPKYFDIGYPLVTSKNLKNGMITDKDIKYISKDDYDKINERSKVDKGDILFAMIGTIGNPVVVEDEPVYAIKNVALFKNIGKINPYFVRYYLESKTVIDKMEREAKGSTQKFVSLGYLRNFIISKPSDLEQNKVVQLINHLLTSERRARDLAESVIAQIDGMKKAILARAFRGELGTNVPGEPACVP